MKRELILTLVLSIILNLSLVSSTLCAGNSEIQIYCDDIISQQQNPGQASQLSDQPYEKDYSGFGIFVFIVLILLVSLISLLFYLYREVKKVKNR